MIISIEIDECVIDEVFNEAQTPRLYDGLSLFGTQDKIKEYVLSRLPSYTKRYVTEHAKDIVLDMIMDDLQDRRTLAEGHKEIAEFKPIPFEYAEVTWNDEEGTGQLQFVDDEVAQAFADGMEFVGLRTRGVLNLTTSSHIKTKDEAYNFIHKTALGGEDNLDNLKLRRAMGFIDHGEEWRLKTEWERIAFLTQYFKSKGYVPEITIKGDLMPKLVFIQDHTIHRIELDNDVIRYQYDKTCFDPQTLFKVLEV